MAVAFIAVAAVAVVVADAAVAAVAALVVLLFSLLPGAMNMRERYWAETEVWLKNRSFEGAPRIDLEQKARAGCLFITDNEMLWARGQARSHANLVDRAEAHGHWERYGSCILWLRDLEDWRWTSLSVRDRTLRLEHLWAWEARGWAELPSGGAAEVWQWTR